MYIKSLCCTLTTNAYNTSSQLYFNYTAIKKKERKCVPQAIGCSVTDISINNITMFKGSEHYSAIRKDEIRPSVTTWRGLENSMLSEMSHRKKSRTISFHRHVGYKTESNK